VDFQVTGDDVLGALRNLVRIVSGLDSYSVVEVCDLDSLDENV